MKPELAISTGKPTISGLLLAVSLLGDISVAADRPYHPSKVRIDIPRVTQSDPDSYQLIIAGRLFWMFPSVVRPTVETAQFIQYMTVEAGERVLDIGTGCGALAIFASDNAGSVVATDIDQAAVDNARYNAQAHGVADKVDVRFGDLFGPVSHDEKFDVILFNVANPLNERTGDPEPLFWLLHERFLAEVDGYLRPGGRIYYHSALLDNLARTREMAERHGLKIVEMHMWTASKRNSEPTLYVLQAK